MTNLIQVHTTASSEEEAGRIADALLAQELAACVQISGPIKSRYRWQGQLEQATEWMCVAKTRADLFDAVESAIRDVHSYDQPEILATAIVAGAQGYLDWVNEVTAGG
ncbi:divalent-cation tolerance protein CutA [Fuerstiella marisgermanici]|uniref:Divalent-cation tolerance protein CutA n=1 Tax=Fuerstiella marisgermanici TaxID=1891926 RepID=A0A1P8WI66_9PLAN|nr:divalent-cation tolerance protein CutA [Fuerstiella marisgermanici]APZ93750.1 Divalent-cation tolerance protein CutA [Fuerstiella marisgermanici]